MLVCSIKSKSFLEGTNASRLQIAVSSVGARHSTKAEHPTHLTSMLLLLDMEDMSVRATLQTL